MASRICWFGYGAGGASMPARRWVLPLSAEKRLSRPKSSFRFASKPGFLPKRARRNRDRAVLNWVRPYRASQGRHLVFSKRQRRRATIGGLLDDSHGNVLSSPENFLAETVQIIFQPPPRRCHGILAAARQETDARGKAVS